VAQARYGLGLLASARGDNPAAMRHFQDALKLYREINARPEVARCLAGIGWVALSQGRCDLAGASFTESLSLSLATGQRLPISRGLQALAVLAAARGEPARSARLEGAARALRETVGDVPSPAAEARRQGVLGAALAALGPEAAQALVAEGRAMSAYAAARYAIDPAAGIIAPAGSPAVAGVITAAGPATGNGRAGARGLTPREQEIAVLVGRGLSNRAIAGELLISPATVARHVANIFVKLAVTSRTQVAAWVAGRSNGDAGTGGDPATYAPT
jgi:DNA-binding NarL/FixJ family response regulator